MFVVTRVEKNRYTLRVVAPMNYDEEAFSWAVSHLQYQFQIKEDPVYTQWPSDTGAQLLVVEGLLRTLCEEMQRTTREDRNVS